MCNQLVGEDLSEEEEEHSRIAAVGNRSSR